MKDLVIKNLQVSINKKIILKDLNLEIKAGESHVIMGPNGCGKSTLALSIMGHPKYKIDKGSITYNGEDILSMKVDERSKLGIFLSFQNPLEIKGITNTDFIRAALNSRLSENQPLKLSKYISDLDKVIKQAKMREDLPFRYLNDGFSGGEKKLNEILQLRMLNPTLAIFDEIDSGLDVDALKIVAENINRMKNEEFSILLITHYTKLLEYIKPTFVHVMIEGQIVLNGGIELIEKINKEGFELIKSEFGSFDSNVLSLGMCGLKNVK